VLGVAQLARDGGEWDIFFTGKDAQDAYDRLVARQAARDQMAREQEQKASAAAPQVQAAQPAPVDKPVQRAPCSKVEMQGLMTLAVSYAVSNSAVTLAGIRQGAQSYKSSQGVTDEHYAGFLWLGLSAVGTIKKDWATSLISLMRGLGTVPSVFAGNGGTFKAWLYLGYDILMHLAEEKSHDDWTAGMKQQFVNAQRVCPDGRITQARMVDENGGRESAVNRNNAITEAKRQFGDWKALPELTYGETLKKFNVAVDVNATGKAITDYDSAKDIRPVRAARRAANPR
jgi:hypothetical protein